MSPSPIASESALTVSIRPRLHGSLQPLFDQGHPCLPALEKTCQKILSLAGGMTGADRLAQLVSRDPGLTCKVLQVANSIAYSPQHVITSVPHAVTWLGLDTVRSIVTAAQLVEQLREWPDKHQVVGGVIARALVAAVHANELGMAIEYPSLSQLFSCALLYSIGDLAVANQSPELYRSLRSLPLTARTQAAQLIEETQLLGVPKRRLAQALAQLWGLPPYLQELLSSDDDAAEGRWQTGRQIVKGLVVGCTALVEAITGPCSASAVEATKRGLLTGTGLPSHLFGEIMVRALDRGKQLVKASGLSFDLWNDPKLDSRCAPLTIQAPESEAVVAATPRTRGPAPIETDPLETLQALQASLREAKDLNTLLGTLVRALYRDGGFARVALALLNPHDTDQLVGRLLLGIDPPSPHLDCLSGSLSHEHPCFLNLLKQAEPTLIEDFTTPMSVPMNPAFLKTWNPGSAIIAPLRIGNRPIGMLYCDRGPLPQRVRSKDYQAFQLFYTQTALSMNRLAGIL
jgi:HD-like signal output (HDOD) protein